MLERLSNLLKRIADRVVVFFVGQEAATEAYFSWNVLTAGLSDWRKALAVRIKAFFAFPNKR